MNGEASFYDRALKRIDHTALVLSVLLVAGAWVRRGWRDAAGCAAGALLSWLNFKLWKKLADSIGPSGRPPARAAALGMRYLALGGVVFVIIKFFEVSVVAVLAGLLVSVAAVIVEIFYELIFTQRKA